jgi:hypothetical protein
MTMQQSAKYPHSTEPSALFLYVFMLQFFLCGCSSSAYLPSAKGTVRSPWNSFNEVKAAFDQIQPYQTDVVQLEQLGFTPETTPNIRILNHLDIMQRFLPNQSISLKDLDEGLQDCLAAKDSCQAYEILIRHIDEERYGNVLLDLFNFRRKTAVSGWEFQALIVLKDDLTVYKIYGGKPTIDESKDSKNPLGPLQSSERVLWNVVQ